MGCSPWGREELDTTAQLHFHFSLSCTGEGKGNRLQCSCLENPSDSGEPGGLPSMGSHRVGDDAAMQQQQQHVTATEAHLKTWNNLCLKCFVAVAL